MSPTKEHLGEQLKRKCLILAVECVGDIERAQPFRDELRRTPLEDLVARFLERAMLAYANLTGALEPRPPATHVDPLGQTAREVEAKVREPYPYEEIHVPVIPAFVATRGAEPDVLVTRAWEAGYRAGVMANRFRVRVLTDRIASLEHYYTNLAERVVRLEYRAIEADR